VTSSHRSNPLRSTERPENAPVPARPYHPTYPCATPLSYSTVAWMGGILASVEAA